MTMTTWLYSTPTARKRHHCYACGRVILPREDYVRQVGLERSAAWTTKLCRHCARAASRFCDEMGTDEWHETDVAEFLEDLYPAVYSSLRARWRYPDGELLPLPFQPRCRACGQLIREGYIWCQACDQRRIERITGQLESLAADLRSAS